MSAFLQAAVSGLVTGSVYALMTVGMTLIYGTLRTLNMAHGSMIMIGGYVAWMVFAGFGLGPIPGMVAAALVAFVFGVAIQQVAVRPLIGRRGVDFEMTAFISTFAVTILLANVALQVYGARNKAVPPVIRGRLHLLEGVSVSWHSLVMAAIAIGTLLALGAYLSKTRYGLAISAVAQQLDAARLMGIPAQRVYNLTMGVSSALAGIAGVLLASVFFVSPNAGDLPLLKALIVAIFGGLGSVRGTILAAYIIGLAEALVSLYLGVKWSLPVLFLSIMVVMLFRPTGLLGKPEEARL
ncbi:MAG TPA: branched-chain amino acid ABC transporter permease [Actinomycetota bacterium]|nr:branched-chain amino acid ABC transporter permease [Actinomycetota bacterium]